MFRQWLPVLPEKSEPIHLLLVDLMAGRKFIKQADKSLMVRIKVVW